MTTTVWLRSCSLVVGRCRLRRNHLNGLVALKNDIARVLSNIDILLKQRHDELSKLLDVCKGYMSFERELPCKDHASSQHVFSRRDRGPKAQADSRADHGLRGSSLSRKLSRPEGQQRLHAAAKTHYRAGEPDRRPPGVLHDSVNTFNTRIQQLRTPSSPAS